jgi:hypothetical protein
MLSRTTHINNPSPKLLQFVRDLQAKKEENKKQLASKKDDYFKKK